MSKVAEWFEKTKVFIHEVKIEMKKVTWPTQEQVKNYMVVVIIASFSLAVVIGLWDFVVTKVVNLVVGLGASQ